MFHRPLWTSVGGAAILTVFAVSSAIASDTATEEKIMLPKPKMTSEVSLEETLGKRQSVRSFAEKAPKWEQVGQLLWAAQGINRPGTRFRTAPSAGALYPLEIYAVLPDGVYHYLPKDHAVIKTHSGDMRKALSDAGLRQEAIQEAACVFVICAVFERTSQKYGDRATRYVYLEAGHAAQNLLLQTVSLGMAGVPIGAMVDQEAQQVLGVPKSEKVIYILATGFPE